MHGPQPGGSGIAPASRRSVHAPLASAFSWISRLAAATYSSTPSATCSRRTTVAAVSRSSSRPFTHDSRYAFWIRISSDSASATLRAAWTVSGPARYGVTRERSTVIRAA